MLKTIPCLVLSVYFQNLNADVTAFETPGMTCWTGVQQGLKDKLAGSKEPMPVLYRHLYADGSSYLFKGKIMDGEDFSHAYGNAFKDHNSHLYRDFHRHENVENTLYFAHLSGHLYTHESKPRAEVFSREDLGILYSSCVTKLMNVMPLITFSLGVIPPDAPENLQKSFEHLMAYFDLKAGAGRDGKLY
jgi:hypothetical protein